MYLVTVTACLFKQPCGLWILMNRGFIKANDNLMLRIWRFFLQVGWACLDLRSYLTSKNSSVAKNNVYDFPSYLINLSAMWVDGDGGADS